MHPCACVCVGSLSYSVCANLTHLIVERKTGNYSRTCKVSREGSWASSGACILLGCFPCFPPLRIRNPQAHLRTVVKRKSVRENAVTVSPATQSHSLIRVYTRKHLQLTRVLRLCNIKCVYSTYFHRQWKYVLSRTGLFVRIFALQQPAAAHKACFHSLHLHIHA